MGYALDSVLAQTDSSWEAIVVNDGSTDNTAAIIDAYAARDSRIRAVHKENGGVASALNRGLSDARGRWVHWLSSDDMFEPNKLAINRRWIEKVPACNFFFSYFTLLTEATGNRERRQLWGPLPSPEYQILGLFYRNYISGISICVNRAAWEKIGFFNEELYYAQDYDQWLRLLSRNQATFIPEWTVISRNHADQGSESFPDACYFDTAKAGIGFINSHSFPQLVPWVDLNNTESAVEAISSAFDIACDRSSFLYSLGVHSALVFRVLEWVFSEKYREYLYGPQVRARVSEMALRDSDDSDWSWMWRQLAVLLADGVDAFLYSPTDPLDLGCKLYRSRLLCKSPALPPVSDYLTRFMNVEVSVELPPGAGNARIVFFVFEQTKTLSAFIDVAEHLINFGYRPIILIEGHSVGVPENKERIRVPILRAKAHDKNSLPWLGEFELGVALPSLKIPVWAGAKQKIDWDEHAAVEINLHRILSSQTRDMQNSRRPVIFLERVLWGGGAERVIYNIVSYLNRQRYRPIVLTMFDEHCKGPKLPADVEVINVLRELFAESHANKAPDNIVVSESLNTIRSLLRRLRFLYHCLSPEFRRRIGIGQQLLKIRTLYSSFMTDAHKSNVIETESLSIGVSAPTSSILDLDFISAMAHHNPAATGLIKAIEKFGDNCIAVTAMEEAAVTAWLAQAAQRFPYIASLHTYESLCLPTIYPVTSRCKAEKWLLSSACKDAKSVVFPSKGCAADLAENFQVNGASIKTIWNPVDCANIRQKSFCEIEAVTGWVKANKKFRMVHVGRLDSQKNHELLLRTCTELIRRGRDFSLAIVGEGGERSAIELQIREQELQEYVFLSGEQINPFPWMAAADVLVLTSHFEAFALVLVEAMACGAAVISVDCPTGPAEVLDSGQYGILVANGDCGALASAVELLMNDDSLKAQFVEAGYLRAEVFDVKNVIPQWESLIDGVN